MSPAVSRPQRGARGWRSLLIGLIPVIAVAPVVDLATGPAPSAEAAIITPFGITYTTNDTGAIDLIGNALLTCPASATCTNVLNGTTSGSNNDFSMVAIDRDTDPTTASSSSAALNMPAGSTVLFAGLYWSGTFNDTTARSKINFKPPGAASYSSLTASKVAASGSLYQGFIDVTSTVRATGNGVYWGADVKSFSGVNTFAGWSLVVAYQNPALPMRNLTVFDGLATVTAGENVDIPISGFLAPPFGAVNAEVGVVAYEGDGGISGDAFLLSNNLANTTFTTLSNARNPANNFFNSSISDNGVADTAGNPSSINVLSLDIDEVSTVGIVPNSATSSVLRLQSSGDAYYPGVVTYAVDLYAPAFPAVTKTVVDVNGGNAEPGDTLEYSITMQNTGLDPAINAIMRDVVPVNTTLVPGSIKVGTAGVTDAAGDDVGEYVAASRSIIVRVGAGASATTGGRLNPTDTFTVKFRVTIDQAGAGTNVENTTKLDYRALTIAKDLTFTSNMVSTPVTPRADLVLAKTGTPSPAVAGQPATWTVTATNNGPNPATGVVVADTVGAGLVPTSASWAGGTCTISGSSVTCPIGGIAVGQSVPVTIVTAVDPALAEASTVQDTATVKANEADPRPGNEATSAALSVTTRADVGVTKAVSANPIVPGRPISYTLTVTNAGPSVARTVNVGETLPTNLVVSGVTTSVGTCRPDGSSCDLGMLAPGASVTITVSGTVDAGATAAVTNSARVTSSTTDPATANNSATLTTPVSPIADVTVAKRTATSPVVAGAAIRWVLTASNTGPSDAAGVKVVDTLPAGVTVTSVSSAVGTCSTAAGVITCTLGMVRAGGSSTITIDGVVAAGTTGSLANSATISTTSTQPAGGGATDTASTSDPVTRSADLGITKSVDHNPLVAGEAVVWTVTVANAGPSDAGPYTVTETLPSQVLSPSVTSAAGGTCSIAGRSVTCTWPSLTVGTSRAITVRATVDPAATTVEPNRATVTSSNDPNAANDTAETRSDLTAVVDLQAAKSWGAASVTAGSTTTVTLTATNAGPSAATGVSLVDMLPAGVTVSGALPAGCSSNGATPPTVTCTIGALAVGASSAVTIPVAIGADVAAGTLSNTVDIPVGPTDPNTGNNRATATTTVARRAQLTLTKSAAATGTAGSTVAYTLVARNAGPSSAELTLVGDQLPAGTTVVAPLPAGCTLAGGLLTCNLGLIAPGAQVTVTYNLLIDSATPSGTVLTNNAQLTSTTPFAGPVTAAASVTVATAADLGVTKTATPTSVVAGEALTWTITATNRGPSAAATVVVGDTLPTGYTMSSVSTTAGTCSGTPLTCTIPQLAAGASVTITVLGRVNAGFTATSIANTATIKSATAEPAGATAPNSATATATVANQADLKVTKSVSPATIRAGDGPVTYTIAVSNQGPSDAAGVKLTDVLPAEFAGAATTRAGCTITGRNLACDLGTLAAGAAPVTITLTGYVPSTTPAGPVNNTATATSTTTLRNPADDSATATFSVTREADIWVKKAPDKPATVAGGTVTWTITVGNDGPSTADNVVVDDVLPATVDATRATASSSSGTCAITGGAVRCTLSPASMAPGSLIFVTVSAPVLPGATPGPTALVNTATVSSTTPDKDPADNSATATSEISSSADVKVVKSVISPVAAGSAIVWTIDVTNAGPSTARAVALDDPTPAGMLSTTVSGAGCTAFPCNLGDIPIGTTRTVTFSGTVDPAFTGVTMTNTATATSTTADPDTNSNTAKATASISRRADLSIAKKASPEPVVAGQSLTYTIEVINAGPSVARTVTVADTLPAEVTFTGAPPAGCTVTGRDISCSLGDLPVAATPVTRTFAVAVAAGLAQGSTFTNTATVASPTDTNTANNRAQVASTVDTRADLVITKSALPSPIIAGQPVTYTLVVTNKGPSTARATRVTDPMPTGLTATAASSTTAGVSCTAAATVTCSLGDLAAGASVTMTVTAATDASLSAPVGNTANVAATTVDPDPASNSATISTPVTKLADVTITKELLTSPVVPGTPLRYRLLVRNVGPSTAAAVKVSDPLPAGLAPTAASSSAGTCVLAATITCDLGALPPNPDPAAPVTILIDAGVTAGFTGKLDNTATVSTTTTEPAGGGRPNSASAGVEVQPQADLRVVKTAPNVPIRAGTVAVYTVTVFNDGPSDATRVTLTDTLPPELAGAAVSPPNDCTVTTGPIVCAWPEPLRAGTSRTITVDATIPSSATSVTDNAVRVSATTPDPKPANNTATAGIQLVTYADVSLVKTGPDALTAGETGRWQITATNRGPSDARKVVITDVFPAGLVPRVIDPAVNCEIGADGDPQKIRCIFDPIPAGGAANVTVDAAVTADQPAGPVKNTATATTPTPDDDQSDNTAVWVTEIGRSANVTIVKDTVTPTVLAGEQVVWKITAANPSGPSSAESVTVSDQLPAGTSFVSAEPAGLCTEAGGLVTCDLGLLAPGASTTITLTALVGPDVASEVAATLVNTATVSTITPGDDPTDSTDDGPVDVSRVADLGVVKTASPTTVNAGEPVVWRIEVTNHGPSEALGVAVADLLPAGFITSGVTDTLGLCTGVTDLALQCGTAATLPSGGTWVITVSGRMSPALDSTTWDNTASVAAVTGQGANAFPDSAKATVTVTRSADVSVVKTASPAQVTAGETITWTLTVTNDGPSDADNVTVTDTLPGDINSIVVSGAGCSTVVCNLGTIPVGESRVVTIAAIVDSSNTASSLANTAFVRTPDPDPDPTDNNSTVTTPVVVLADLSVSKSANPSPATAGSPLTWDIVVRNDGSSDARSVVVTDTLPAGVNTIATTETACTIAAPTITCSRPVLAAGETWTIPVSAVVDAALTQSSLVNRVVVTSTTPDADADDQDFTLDTPLEQHATLTLAKAGVDVLAGQRTTWTMTVGNTGPSDAAAVVLDDVLPATLSAPVVTSPATGCTITDLHVVCELGILAAGASIDVVVTALVDPAFGPGTIDNTATASSPTAAEPATASGTITVGTGTDLQVFKSGPAEVVPGVTDAVVWTIRVVNAGPSEAREVVVDDPVSAEVTGYTIAGAGGCTTFPCPLGTVPAGGEVVITVTGTLSADTAMSFLDNRATVTSVTPELDDTNNSSAVSSNVTPRASIVVDKTGPASTTPGQPVTWTITVRNDGPSIARTVELDDAVPAAIDAASVVVAGDCTAFPCALGDLPVGATRTITVTGTVDPSATAPLDNTATVTSPTPPGDADQRSDTVTTTLTPVADLAITKQFAGTSTTPGTAVRWVVEVTNLGPSTAVGVVVDDALPTHVTGSLSTPVGSCTGARCDLGDMLPGAVITITIDGTLSGAWLPGTEPDGSDGTLDNTATVTSTTPDNGPSPNTATTNTPVTPQADLHVTKTGPAGAVIPGEQVSWSISVVNEGPSNARNVVLTDPVNGAILNPSVTGGGGACSLAGTPALLTCNFGELNMGQQIDVVVSGVLRSGYADPRLLNTATVTGDTPDPDPADNVSEAGNDVTARADVTVTAAASVTDVLAGNAVDWTFTASNAGPSDAVATVVRIPLPAALIDVADAVITDAPPGTTWRIEAGELIVELGALPPGQVVTIALATRVAPSYTGATIEVPISISTTTTQLPGHDPDTASATVNVTSQADLTVTKTAAPDPATAGEPIRWTITVTNAGPSDARDTALTDVLPAGLTGATVSGSGCTSLPCALGTLAPGATAVVTVEATIDSSYRDPAIANTATVATSTTDPDPAGNTATATTPVNKLADLSVTKVADPSPATAGLPVSWTITVRNDGSSDAFDVVATDTYPAVLVGAAVTDPGCVLDTAARTVTCSRSSLAAGAQWAITLTGTVDSATTDAAMTNRVTVSSSTPDVDAADQDFSLDTPLEQRAVLTVAKTGTDVAAGQRTTWTMTVGNDGPSAAQAVQLGDDLPPEMSAIVVESPAAGCGLTDHRLDCDLGILPAGGSAQVVVSGIVDPAYGPAPLANTVTATSPTAAAPATATGTITVAAAADVSVVKTGPATVIPGATDGVTWTITVRNDGPSEARDVVLDDVVPVEMAVWATTGGPCTGFPCLLGTLAPGAEVTIPIVGTVAADAMGTLTNAALVSASTPDPDDADLKSTTTAELQPAAALVVDKIGPATAVPGTTATWTISVTANGPSVARAVSLADVLPAAIDPATVAISGDCVSFSCDLGDLPAGTVRNVTISGTVRPEATGTVDNTASVTSATPPPAAGDQRTDTTTTSLAPSADVRITKTLANPPAVPGLPVRWVITVTNAGPSTAAGVVVDDALPLAALADLVMTTDTGSCGATTCTLGDLAPGATATIFADATLLASWLPGTAPDGTDGTLDNSVTATSSTPDPDPANTATTASPVAPSADVHVSKSGPVGEVVPGQQVTWTIQVVNDGPSAARSVVLTDPVPGAVRNVTVTGPAGACTVAGTPATVTCDLGQMTPGQIVDLVVTGTLSSDFLDPRLLNTATVTAATPDPDPADNVSEAGNDVSTIADVTVTAEASAPAVLAGNPVTWTFTVSNAGPSDAQATVVRIPLPVSLIDVADPVISDAPAGTTWRIDGGVLIVEFGSFPAGGLATISLTTRVDPSYTGASIDVPITVSTTTTQPAVHDPDTATATVTVTSEAAVSITKTAAPDPVIAGEPIRWTITVTNAGPSDARDTTVSDTLPAAALNPVISGGGCTAFPCALGTLAPGAVVTITVDATVDPALTAGSISNSASAVSTTTDPDPADNSATAVTTVDQLADLSVTKTATPSPAVAGTPQQWLITVRNDGSSDAVDVIVTDTFPFAAVPAPTTPNDTCTIDAAAGTITCNRASLAAGATWEIDVEGDIVSAAAGASLPNRVAVTSSTPDEDAADQDFSLDSPLEQHSALRATKSGTDASAGERTTWLITVFNDGPSDAPSLTIADDLPAQLSVLTVDSPATGCSLTGSRLDCTLGALVAGGSTQVVVSGRVDPAFGPGAITNTATVTAPTADAPVDATGSITVAARADVAITKVGPATAIPGVPNGVQWTVTVRNNGPSEAREVVVTDVVPAEVSGYSLTGAACAQFPCALGTLAPGAEVVLTATATLAPDASAASITNTATVSTSTPDTVPGNDTAGATTDLAPEAAVTVDKVGPATAVPGTAATWTISVANAGPSVARTVELADVVPPAIDPATVTITGDCATLPCSLGDLPVGATRNVTVTGTVRPEATGTIDNTATLSSPTPAPAAGDQRTDTVTTTLVPSADVTITKTVAVAPVVPGTPVRWTLTVTNAGPSTAAAVVVDDPLPAAVTGGALTSDTGSCTGTSCALGDLAPNATATITVDATILAGWLPGTAADGSDGTLDNTATVTSPTADPQPEGNAATTQTAVAPNADLNVTKTGPAGAVVPGEQITWNISVRNDGASDARGVVLVDPIPAGITGATVTALGGRCAIDTATNEVRCTIGTMAVGEQIDLTVTGTLTSNYADPRLLNTATATLDTPDSDPADNVSEVGNDVTTIADVTVTAAVDPALVVAGNPVTWTFAASNAGPSDAQATTLRIPIPAALTAGDPVISDAPAGTTWRVEAGALIVELGALPPGQVVTISLPTTVSPSFTGASIDVPITVTTSTFQPVGHDPDEAVATVAVTTSADLAVTKTASPDPATAGTPLTWTITVTNAGPSDAQDVDLADTLPSGIGDAVVSGAGCTGFPCRIGLLAAGATATVTVTATVDPANTATSITNTASVTSATPDPDETSNAATVATPLGAVADLSITKQATVVTAVAGTPIGWTITVTNAGPSDAQAVAVSDQLPASVPDASSSTPGCSVTGGLLTCNRATLPAGETWAIDIAGTVATGATGAEISNTATVASPTTDPDDADRSATAVTPLERRAAVRMTKSGTDAAAGELTTWTIDVTNDGPSDAEAVAVADDIPAAIGELQIITGADLCTLTGNRLDCALGTMLAGVSRQVVVTGRIAAATPAGPIDNTATATSPTLAAPVVATGTIQVGTSANVSIVKTGPAAAVPGVPDAVQWTITVRNAGPSDAQGVVVADPLPAEVAASTISGGGCTAFPCDLGTLAAGGEVAITVTATVAADAAAASMTNTASVSTATADPDPDPANDTSSVTTALNGRSRLVVDKAGPATVVPGTAATWTISVTNEGPSVARSVDLSDALPAALDPATLAVTGACTAFPCNLGDLAVGEVRNVTVTGTIRPEATGSADNTATVASPTPAPDGGDQRTDTTTTTLVPSADVTIIKAFTGTSATPGSPVQWVLTVTNAGPSTATAVVVDDALPTAALTDISVGTDLGSCTAAGRCELGDLAPGATVTITVDATLLAGWLPGTAADGSDGTLGNTATVSSPTADPDLAGDTATTATAVTPDADLHVVKAGPVGAVAPGEEISWTISVRNDGPSDSRGVVLTDAVPTAITGATVSSLGGRCALDAGTNQVTCTIGTMTAGEQVDLVVTGRLRGDYLDPALLNTAGVLAATPDSDPADNTSQSSTDVTTVADVTVTASADVATALAGTRVNWTFTVSNAGPSDARATTVRIPIPAALLTAGDPRLFDAPVGATWRIEAGVLIVELGAVPAGQVVTIVLPTTVAPSFTGATIDVTATVTTTTPQPPVHDPDEATASIGVSAAADLTITKTSDPTAVIAGRPLTWTITVTNTGPSDAVGVNVADPLPGGLSGTSITGAGCSAFPCLLGTMAPGATATITVTATLDPATTATSIANTASVSSGTADPDPASNSATATTAVGALADLSISKTATVTTAVAGTPIGWTIIVRNDGSSDAQSVVVTDQLPIAVVPDVATTTSRCAIDAGVLTCNRATLAAGEMWTIDVAGTVASSAAGAELANSATVASPTPDVDADDQTSTVTVPLERRAVVRATKTGTDTLAGSATTWTIDVVNDGPSDAAAVTVVDDLPASMTGLSIATGADLCTLTDHRLECALGTMLPGASRRIVIDATVLSNTPAGMVTNTAVVSSPTLPTPVEATGSITVTEGANVSLAKTGPATVAPGVVDAVTWTISVHNAGPSEARNVVVSDPAPATMTAFTLSGWPDCTGFPCSLGTLPPGAEVTLTVTGTVDPAATGMLSNSASVSSDTPDPIQGDNASTWDAQLTPAAAITVDKAGPASATPGTPLTWTITVTNSGPATATAVELTDVLPAGLDPATVAISGDCAALPCTLGDLPPAAMRTITVTASVLPGSTGSLANTASVSSATPAPDGGDHRSATATTGLAPSADLRVTKTLAGDAAVPGTPVRWTITVTNPGPSTATGVTVTDLLPDGALDGVVLTPSAGSCTAATCTIGTLEVGATATISVDGVLRASWLPPANPDGTPGTLLNRATVSSDVGDPDPASNDAGSLSPVAPSADLHLTKTGPVGAVVPGEEVSWTIALHNDGPSDARDIGLVDTLPAGLSDVRVTGLDGCQLSAGPDGRVAVACMLPLLASGGQADVVITGRLASGYADAALLNTATVTSSTPDPDPADNTSSAGNDTAARADVTVTATVGAANAAAGEAVTWTFTAANRGPSDARKTVLRIPIPASLVVNRDPRIADAPAGTTWRIEGGVLIVELGSLPPGAVVTLTLDTSVASGFTGAVIALPITVTTTTPQPALQDPDEASAAIEVFDRADLSLTKTVADPIVRWNTEATFTLTVRNAGPSDGKNVVVIDDMPAGMTPVRATWPNGTCDVAGQRVRCSLGSVAPGSEVVVTVVGRALGDGRSTNTASLESSSPDPSPADRAATAGFVTEHHADLGVTKTASVAEVTQGGRLAFTIVAHSAGPDDVNDVVVTDRLPAGFGLISTTATVGAYDAGSGTWRIGTFAAGATATLTMTVEATELGRLINTAAIAGAMIDPTPGDANASAAVVVVKQNQGSLPITGSDVSRLALVGLSALLLGATLRRRARRRTAA